MNCSRYLSGLQPLRAAQWRPLVLVCFAGLMGGACGSEFPGGAPAPRALVASPRAVTLRVGDSVRLAAVALGADLRPVTSPRRWPQWRSSDPVALALRPVSVPESGTSGVWAQAVQRGTYVATAESGGQRDSVLVRVEQRP
jgi:hypothetical protein